MNRRCPARIGGARIAFAFARAREPHADALTPIRAKE